VYVLQGIEHKWQSLTYIWTATGVLKFGTPNCKYVLKECGGSGAKLIYFYVNY